MKVRFKLVHTFNFESHSSIVTPTIHTKLFKHDMKSGEIRYEESSAFIIGNSLKLSNCFILDKYGCCAEFFDSTREPVTIDNMILAICGFKYTH